MTTPARPPAGDGDSAQAAAAADAARPDPEGFAISPAVGGLPAIYVPRSPDRASTGRRLWRAVVRAAGRAARRVSRHEHAHMGEIMTDIPADLRYSKDHLWARPDEATGRVRVGVTDFAQQSLGDVIDVSPPRPGGTVTAGEPCGEVESTKSLNDLVAPVSGTVATGNGELSASPELVNTDPYGQGWMFDVDIDPATLGEQLAVLMDAAAYRRLVGE